MSAELEYLNEENGRLRRAVETYKAELALRIAEIDSLQIDKGHMRAEVDRLTALEEATRKANLDCMDHYNEARAEVERLKAQLGEWQGLAGIQGDMIKTIASGAAPAQEPVAWVVFNTDGTPEYAAAWRDAAHEHIKDMQDRNPDYSEVAQWVVRPVYLASGAAPKENT